MRLEHDMPSPADSFDDASTSMRSRLVLVADDDRRSARLLARMLRDDGFEVELAFDGATAVGRLSRDPVPSVLVTDLRMPHVGGTAVARYALSRAPEMRIIFVTSYPELLSKDVRGLLHRKPIDYVCLRRQLDDALSSVG